MSEEWDASDSDTALTKARSPPTAAAASKKPAAKPKKWEGEDEEDDEPVSDWEESSEEESDTAPAPVATAPPKKKGTLKAKLAEKEAMKAKAKENGEDVYDSDDVLDPRAKAKRDKELELNADLNNAADLLGAAALGGTSSAELDSLLTTQLRTKEDVVALSEQIIQVITRRIENKPLYASFVEHHVKALAGPLKDVEVRKAASGLTTLANEKQKEARDKASGKKKSKAAAKPALGAAKVASKLDTNAYEEALDDFGPDDFM
jgi:translation initiation factor 3 subunit J